MDDTRKPSDLSYKLFFSYPLMVMALFEEYVKKSLLGIVDFSTLERLNGEYVSEELLGRSDDIVWRVNLRTDSGTYIIVVLEFQSSPDNLMALRMRSYSSLLLLDVARQKHPSKQHSLPIVLPIVMYNGKRQWNVPLGADSLFASAPDMLDEFCPRQRYILLDERHIPDEELNKHNGLVTQLIKLERAQRIDELEPIFRRLEELLPEPEYASLSRMFALWAEYALKCAGFIEESRTFRNLQEVKRMLFENAANWKNVYIQEGEERGEKRGEERGCGRLLRILLEDRFGTIPESVNEFIASSDSESLTSLFRFANKAPSMQAITDRIKGAQALA